MADEIDQETAGEPEVRERPREPVFNLPWIVVAIIAACFGVHALREWVLTSEQDHALITGVFLAINLATGAGLDLAGGAMIAWEAHIGGLVAGLVGLPLFDRRRRPCIDHFPGAPS